MYMDQSYRNQNQGILAETAINLELAKLPKTFLKIPGYTVQASLDKNPGNIDFIIIGPTGLFLIEVKSHRGDVIINRNPWSYIATRRYGTVEYEFEKDFFEQILKQREAIRNIIHHEIGIYPPNPHSILVFTNQETKIHFKCTKPTEIDILKSNELIHAIRSGNHWLESQYIEQLYRALLRYREYPWWTPQISQ